MHSEGTIIFGMMILMSMVYIFIMKHRKKRNFWVNPYLWKRRATGRYYTDVRITSDYYLDFNQILNIEFHLF